MSIDFNADEIFEMAEQIERNGAKFYQRAAQGMEEPSRQQLLLQLAAMEAEHEKIFSSMRAGLSREEEGGMVFDPEDQTGQYLRAMADGKIFDMRADPAEGLTGRETLEDILRTAIAMEKDSVVFYLGMKAMVPEGAGKDKIDLIIKEELSHIGTLSMELASVNQ